MIVHMYFPKKLIILGMGKNGHVKWIEPYGTNLLEAHTNCFEWFKKIVCRKHGNHLSISLSSKRSTKKKERGLRKNK
jgi:6-phosphogluconolactonase/glucosamine-6-phosphate isomerase/deaminase